ncbi:hypothetical protein C343_00024 [Cryptococcus neoformans C23]|uniref:Cyclin N-terminal domain-containing protein n=1 Tax=Cryptococcus neoformans (strain H99 / ATCC 208821 / CBS 10515 / FGSC 9487) TaxID=235443 RepID=J9VD12_CRYN9|nr:hypothetical protein CNAG_00024 [Cryptococcus neoformans var. grubii H99]AUB21557.1 hypothetical protein CKF44_00024 [Cryptococcus neoformans var. grubii]OWZ37673.1 hypothetical protein C347_00025 [Cryptococcus neoformans var. grubii AD2-60a]OWZ48577.1 hypothetical protein C343_00024 [Cryptococcus neoformans var. grubii C23]OXC87624.1 hypothetical protein C344_00027 [Cryptococcus neoformans var. grubii AD1-7a]AFR92162.2 hypothetical protein CNAG_00024 [Cryptococcus neoformans var. grubii H9|eukprot:XP_012046155.1 hypothetical protein CNAG_00024 [Cryptococcus neoformans var. grubii H99]
MPYMYERPIGQQIKQRREEEARRRTEMELYKLLNGDQAGEVATFGNETVADGMEVDNSMYGRHQPSSLNGRLLPTGFDATNHSSNADWMYDAEARAAAEYSEQVAAQQAAIATQQSKAYLFEREFPDPVNYHTQRSVWSPPRAEVPTWSNYEPAYRAPAVPARYVQLPERPITPHDTYRYPASHAEHIYVAPPAPVEPSADAINGAFAFWYAQQVIHLLIVPGQFRAGTGGASDEEWGPAGREKDSYMRVGVLPPDYSRNWGRMGMTTSSSVTLTHQLSPRRPEYEARDPWNVAWAHSAKPTATFVSFILDMIQRMTISPSALVAGVWFLAGLGLHEGDGVKGTKLRQFLREQVSCEPEAVEKRVAMLGLILAGKWLDDNSFLTKSWTEVTSVPISQIDKMERLALADFNFSLYVPVPSWVDHVNKLFTALDLKHRRDEVDSIIHPMLDKMAKEAREVELSDPAAHAVLACTKPVIDCRSSSSDEIPAAADQATSRDWVSFASSYAHDQKLANSRWSARGSEDDVELERAERNVEMLLSDEDMDEVEQEVLEQDEDEEEFLEYDGAKKWLPTASEMRRSTSGTGAREQKAYAFQAPRQDSQVQVPAPTQVPVTSFVRDSSTTPTASQTFAGRPRAHGDWNAPTAGNKRWHHAHNPFGFPVYLDPSCCQKIERKRTPINRHSSSYRPGYPSFTHTAVGTQIEPGVSIMREPASTASEFGFMNGVGASMCGPKRSRRFDAAHPYSSFAAAGH